MHPKRIFFLMLLTLLQGCCLFVHDRAYPKINYEGDGNFVNYGRCSAIGRFNLKLGIIDLAHNHTTNYKIKGLPETKFAFIIIIDYPLPDPKYFLLGIPEPKKPKWSEAVINLTMLNRNGVEVFKKEASLNDWIWSGAIHGKTSELWSPETRFIPDPAQEYLLKLEVKNASSESPSAELVATGGGWKMQPY